MMNFVKGLWFGVGYRAFYFVVTVLSFTASQAVFSLEGEEALDKKAAEVILKKKQPFISCTGIRHGNADKKMVALTFDDGPHKKYTEKILDILNANNIKGAFFIIGENALDNPGLVKKIYEDGHIVANHTYSHARLTDISGQEIEDQMTKNTKIIKDIIGVEPNLFRPPYGACSVGQQRVARNLGLKQIIWSAITDDYNVDKTSPEKIASEIFGMVGPGGIIVLHDGGGNREKTVAALPILIDRLKRDGYLFVSLQEMLDIQPYKGDLGVKKPSSFMSLAKAK